MRSCSDKKSLYFYMLYVCVWSSILLIIACIFDAIDDLPNNSKPNFGADVCYINSMSREWLFSEVLLILENTDFDRYRWPMAIHRILLHSSLYSSRHQYDVIHSEHCENYSDATWFEAIFFNTKYFTTTKIKQRNG